MKWTPLYYGVSHLREIKDARRASITIWPCFTELTKWVKRPEKVEPGTEGFGFLSKVEIFRGKDHAQRARQAGEKHVRS
jgi:hypothetical protein